MYPTRGRQRHLHRRCANEIFIDYQHDIVAVVRWIDGGKMKDFVRMLVAATGEPAP